MKKQQQQRVLGRILAQSLGACEQQAARALAAGGRPVPGTAKMIHTAPYYFTDGVVLDGGNGDPNL